MTRVVNFLAWVLVSANAVFLAALSYHVVRSGDGVHFYNKTCLTLVDTYSDTRRWAPEQLEAHPVLLSSLEAAKAEALLRDIGGRPHLK